MTTDQVHKCQGIINKHKITKVGKNKLSYYLDLKKQKLEGM